MVNDWLVIWRAPWKGEKKDAVGGRLPARIAGAPYIRSDRPPTVAIRRRLAIRRLMARWRQRVNDGFVAPYLQSLYGCLHPLGPPICPHLGVEVAWPSRTLWPAVALLVPVSVSPPPYRRAGKVRGDGSVWLRGPCPAVRARRTTRSHSPRVLSYAHGHVRL